MPKVSVIVPVYQTKKSLKKCVCSIVKQTLWDIEIILVDDGSPDGAGILCDQIASTDSRIKVIHKINGGLAEARNSALEIIEGDYFGFVDSDDYISPDMYEKLYDTAITTSSDIVICQHYTVMNDSIESSHINGSLIVTEFESLAIWDEFIIPLLGADVKKDDSSQYGFVCRQLFNRSKFGQERFLSEEEYFAEDILFNLTVYPKATKITTLKASLYYYVYNEYSLTNKYRENLWDLFKNRLNWKIAFVEEHNIRDLALTRLADTTFKLIVISILNLYKKCCPYNNKMKIAEIRRMLSDKITINLLKHFQVRYYSRINRVVYFLMRVRCSFILHLVFCARAYIKRRGI